MLDTTYLFDGSLSAAGVPSGAAITTTRVSTNTLDLLTAVDMGAANPLKVRVEATATFLGGTSLQVNLQSCATVGGSYVMLMMSPVLPVAQLIAGAKLFDLVLPVNQLLNATAGVLAKPGRFLQLNYTVVGTFTQGSVFAGLVPDMDKQELSIYPANYTVGVAAGEI